MFICVSFGFYDLKAQISGPDNECGFDEILQQHLVESVDFQQKFLIYQNAVKQEMSSSGPAGAPGPFVPATIGPCAANLIQIPIVVHLFTPTETPRGLMHEANITDCQVIDMIDRINWRLANGLEQDGLFTPLFDFETEDVGIQLVLATQNNMGEDAIGIVRHFDDAAAYLNGADQSEALATNEWPSDQYMNFMIAQTNCQGLVLGPDGTWGRWELDENAAPLWVSTGFLELEWGALVACGCPPVNQASATYPPRSGFVDDGLIFTSKYFLSEITILHEIGHYLGLYHTNDANLYNDNMEILFDPVTNQFPTEIPCDNNNCLESGDEICDTPPTQFVTGANCTNPVSSCGTDAADATNGVFVEDVEDFMENYMERFVACRAGFTTQQVQRMRLSLGGTAAGFRQNLNNSLRGAPIDIVQLLDWDYQDGVIFTRDTRPLFHLLNLGETGQNVNLLVEILDENEVQLNSIEIIEEVEGRNLGTCPQQNALTVIELPGLACLDDGNYVLRVSSPDDIILVNERVLEFSIDNNFVNTTTIEDFGDSSIDDWSVVAPEGATVPSEFVDYCAAGNTGLGLNRSSEIYSPLINLTNADNASLSFEVFFNSTDFANMQNDYLEMSVMVSTDLGATYEEISYGSSNGSILNGNQNLGPADYLLNDNCTDGFWMVELTDFVGETIRLKIQASLFSPCQMDVRLDNLDINIIEDTPLTCNQYDLSIQATQIDGECQLIPILTLDGNPFLSPWLDYTWQDDLGNVLSTCQQFTPTEIGNYTVSTTIDGCTLTALSFTGTPILDGVIPIVGGAAIDLFDYVENEILGGTWEWICPGDDCLNEEVDNPEQVMASGFASSLQQFTYSHPCAEGTTTIQFFFFNHYQTPRVELCGRFKGLDINLFDEIEVENEGITFLIDQFGNNSGIWWVNNEMLLQYNIDDFTIAQIDEDTPLGNYFLGVYIEELDLDVELPIEVVSNLFECCTLDDSGNEIDFDITEETIMNINGGVSWVSGNNPFGNVAIPLINHDVILLNGDYTIDGMEMRFGPRGRIIVKENASLFLRDAHLRATGECMWQGIQVEGGGTFDDNSGVLSIDANESDLSTLIEDAVIGVALMRLPVFDFDGIQFQNINNAFNIDDINVGQGEASTNILQEIWTLEALSTSGGKLEIINGTDYSESGIFQQNIEFRNCFQGINASWLSNHAELEITNCHFRQVDELNLPFEDQNTDAGVFSLLYTIISMDNNLFEDLDFGVRSNGILKHVEFNHNKTFRCQTGFSGRNFDIPLNLQGAAYIVSNNEIWDSRTGIQAESSILRASNNHVETSTPNIPQGAGFFISGSEFTLDNNLIRGQALGTIALSNNSWRSTIRNNLFSENNVSFVAIGDNGSDGGIDIECNTFENNLNERTWLINDFINNDGTIIPAEFADQGFCGIDEFTASEPTQNVFNSPNSVIEIFSTTEFTYANRFDADPNLHIPAFWTSGTAETCPNSIDMIPVEAQCTSSSGYGIKAPSEIVNIDNEAQRNKEAVKKVHYYLENDQLEEAKALLSEIATQMGDKKLISYFIEHGLFEEADERMENLEQVKQEDIDYKTYYEIIRNIRYSERSFFELSEEETSSLRELAMHHTKAGFAARGILFTVFGEIYPIILNEATLPEGDFTTYFKTNPVEGLVQDKNKVKILPNPASNTVSIEYPEITDVQIFTLTFGNGQKVKELNLAANTNQAMLDISELPTGLYFYKLGSEVGKLLIMK